MDGRCLFDDCDRSTVVRGYCKRHYEQLRRGGVFASSTHTRLPRLPSDAMERFLARVEKRGEHWIWTAGTTGSKSTYGVFSPGGPGPAQVYAHRWIYEQSVGPIPVGWEVDHRCRIPLCVNPACLEAVTSEENSRRTRLDVCRSGLHDLTDPKSANWDPKGRRRGCIECGRARARATARRKYEAVKAAKAKE